MSSGTKLETYFRILADRIQDSVKGKALEKISSTLPQRSVLALEYPDLHIHTHLQDCDTDEGAAFVRDAVKKLVPSTVFAGTTKGKQANAAHGPQSRIRRPDKSKTRRIVLAHHRALGDEIMFSAGVRDFCLLFPHFKVNVEGNHPAVWKNNPYIDHTIKKEDPGVEYYRVGYKAINSANNTYLHFTQMFLLDILAQVDEAEPLPISIAELAAAFSNGEVGDPGLSNPKKNTASREPFIGWASKYRNFSEKFARMRGDLHLTSAEKATNIVKDLYGVEHYWVVAPGGKRDVTAKIWDWRGFSEVVEYFRGRIKFVAIGKSDLIVERIPGVIDMIDTFNTDLRGLFSLVYNSKGCVGGPSALMHIAAALPFTDTNGKIIRTRPFVAIMGGREPTGWTWYTHHQILHTNGALECCRKGGCWRARVTPLPKDPQHNKNLCSKVVKINGKSVQECMSMVTPRDVIRAIERYIEGDYGPGAGKNLPEKELRTHPRVRATVPSSAGKRIALLGNLHTKGGGEQSLCTIAGVLVNAGWTVLLYPFDGVHENYRGLPLPLRDVSFKQQNGEHGRLIAEDLEDGTPLLFYANDSIWDFIKWGGPLVDRVPALAIGINYVLGDLKKPSRAGWLARSGKLRAVICQNNEKAAEFRNQAPGFEKTRVLVNPGAIDLQRFLDVSSPGRQPDDDLVVLKHCVADYRKYVTAESEGKGDRPHLWQRHIIKERDIKFYSRLLKSIPGVRFRFMEAHGELKEAFKGEPRMEFLSWDELPVDEFLASGHVYLYRTSNLWRDQYPRVVGEALAVGLPVITEPRDGTLDRVINGETGFHCVDYDAFCWALKLLKRKEKYRMEMAQAAKDWARENLDPRSWVSILEEVFYS